jgi:hypothetical protein
VERSPEPTRYPGRRQAETYEHNHAFDVRGVVNLDIGGVRIRNVGGDFFYLAGGYMPGGSFRHSQDVRIHDIDAQGTAAWASRCWTGSTASRYGTT